MRQKVSTPLSSSRKKSGSIRRLYLRPFAVACLFILLIELSNLSSLLQSHEDEERANDIPNEIANEIVIPTMEKSKSQPSIPTSSSTSSSTSSITTNEIMNMTQQIVILAGPHKTGTTAMQTNMWQWTSDTTTTTNDNNDNNNKQEQRQESIFPSRGWVWPVPPKILEIEDSDTHKWDFTPSKGFYMLLEALGPKPLVRLKKERQLFQYYNKQQVLQIYKEYLREQWEEGKNIIFGTEAFDVIIKDPERGIAMLKRLNHILPDTTTPPTTAATTTTTNDDNTKSTTTVVVMYRTSKIKHLISIWHQNTVRRTDPNFYEWFTTTNNSLGALDALGMVELFLKYTSWNVVLLDSSGLRHTAPKSQQKRRISSGNSKNKKKNTTSPTDASHVIACDVMNIPCDSSTKRVLGLEQDTPVVTNVREDQRPPNVHQRIFNEMNVVLNRFECNYQHLFQDESSYRSRLKVLHPTNILSMMEDCKDATDIPESRIQMKEQLVDIVIKAGKSRI